MTSFVHAAPVDEQRAGVDAERHLGQLGLHERQLGHRRAEQFAFADTAERLVERAAREPERGGADGGAEHVERRERDPHALAGLADQQDVTGARVTREAAMAKLHATESAQRTIDPRPCSCSAGST